MSFKWLPLFISISLLGLYDAASTAVHSNAYNNLLRTYNSERTATDYHEKVYEILGGAQGFSDKPTTPAQLSNIVYITVHAALNSKEPDNLFLQKTLKENQSLIYMPSLSEERKQDRIYHYGILMVVYAATKLSQQDGNIFTLPERVQNYLKNLAEDSILTGVLAQPLKDILSGVNKDGIAQILVGYKFTNAYHSVSLNAGGLMLDGAAVVDYTHSGITTRDSSSTVTPSSSTGNMASVGTSDVPADIAHLSEENRKKLRRMQLFEKTEANDQARARQIDTLTRSQETSTSGAGGSVGIGALLGGKKLNKTEGPSVASVVVPQLDLTSMFNLSAIKKIGKDLNIKDTDNKDEKIAKLQNYKVELVKVSQGADETEKKQASDYIKIVEFLIKELKKVRGDQQLIDLLTKRGPGVESLVFQKDESSITKEIEKLRSQIVTLESEIIDLEALKASSGSAEKVERQIVGKTKLIEGKQQAIRDKIKERGLLIGKKKNERETNSVSEGVTDASLTSMSPPIIETGSASPSFIPLGEPEVLLAAPASPPIIVTKPAAPSIIISPPVRTKVNSVPPPPLAPVLPKKPLKIVATGSIFADLSMSHTGSLRKVGSASPKTTGVKKTLDVTGVEEEINKHKVKITELQLEIDNLEASKAVAGTDLEREKIEKKIIAKRNLIEGKELALKKRQEELDKISSNSLASQMALRALKTHGDDDSGTDSDDDEEDWN